MRNILLVVCLTVSGCSGMVNNSVISSSERTVVVESFYDDLKKAQLLADAECAKYQRVARLSGPARNYKLIYDCVL